MMNPKQFHIRADVQFLVSRHLQSTEFVEQESERRVEHVTHAAKLNAHVHWPAGMGVCLHPLASPAFAED